MPGDGILNYPAVVNIVDKLGPFWRERWPIQIHVNGDRSILEVLNALALLQAAADNGSPVTLLHFTLDGKALLAEDMVQKAADFRNGSFNRLPVRPLKRLSVSHLIGHVAYWGGAFEKILDGVEAGGWDPRGRATRIVATRREIDLGVPFSPTATRR